MKTKFMKPFMNDNPAVDIVVPTYGRGNRIRALIDSILQSDYPNYIMWIIDQSENDLTEKVVSPYTELDTRIRYLRDKHRGSNIARNIGASHGDAPLILFTDDDCRVTEGWLRAMVAEFKNSYAWAVFGRILADELLDPGHPRHQLVKLFTIAYQDLGNRVAFENDLYNLNFGHGANMGFRRDCFELIKGFDNLMGSGGKFRAWPERDIGFRILAKGGCIVYTPTALLFHDQWRDWPALRKTYRNYAFGAGAAVAKYLRCGYWKAIYLYIDWIFSAGIRQIISGLIKYRSWKKIEVGLGHLIIPWIGMIKSIGFPINREDILYKYKGSLFSQFDGPENIDIAKLNPTKEREHAYFTKYNETCRNRSF